MKPVSQNQNTLTRRLRVRLLAFLVTAILLISIPLLILLTEGREQLQQQHNDMLQQIAKVLPSLQTGINQADSEARIIQLMQAFPQVEAVDLLAASEQTADEQNVLWLTLKGDKVLRLGLGQRQFNHFDVWVLLGLMTVIFLLLLAGWVLSARYQHYFTSLTNFIHALHSGEKTEPFKSDTHVHELNQLNSAVNSLSERVYMQSQTVHKGFEELSHISQLFEFDPSLIVSLNTDMQVAYLNKAFKQILPAKYLNEDVIKVLPDDINEIVTKCILDNRIIQGMETKVGGRSLMWNIVPVPTQTLANCYGVDITQIRQAESQTESAYVDSMMARDESEAKSIFLANMSHEIRTPLTAILGFSESLLESGQSMEDRVVAINTIIRNGRHLLTIINDLLDITKIESGQGIIELESISLKNILENVYHNYSAQAGLKSLDFKLELKSPIPEKLVSDESRIRQILYNLCSNAIKFTEHGSVCLQVSYDNSAGELKIVVKDSGVGIRPSQVDKIFNRFEQLDTGHSRKFGGVGLGLYITRELVERLDGHISVESEVGAGTQFIVVIKAEPVDAGVIENELQIQTEALEEQRVTTIYQGKVLLVEDNTDNQNLIKMYLFKMGAEVVVANNGKEAVQLAANDQFDVILMDMQMPIMDGVEATKLIHGSGNDAPIVMLTANVMQDDMKLCRRVGCKGFLTKPVQRESFERYIADFLRPVDSVSEQMQPIISELVNEGPEFYNIVKAYVKQLPDDLENVVKAYKDKNDKLLKEKVHSMKGTSGNMGYIQYSQLCAQVEFAITKNDRDEILQLIDNLEEMKLRIQAGVD